MLYLANLFTLEIVRGNEAGLVTLGEFGVISTAAAIDREEISELDLQVELSDHTPPFKC